MTQPGKRRLVFCFDGTWNRLNADLPTNVVRIAQMVPTVARDGTPQVVYYNEGVGTGGWLNRFNGGMFGQGMLQIMREAYRFLIFNYQPGDEIYAFGFSRGAYTARSFIGLIRHAGILDVARAKAINRAIEIYRRAPAGQTGEEHEGQVPAPWPVKVAVVECHLLLLLRRLQLCLLFRGHGGPRTLCCP